MSKDSTTLIAFVNKRSGGQRGAEVRIPNSSCFQVLPELYKLLGNDKVFDITEDHGPEKG